MRYKYLQEYVLLNRYIKWKNIEKYKMTKKLVSIRCL